jgi:hypothetical protein
MKYYITDRNSIIIAKEFYRKRDLHGLESNDEGVTDRDIVQDGWSKERNWYVAGRF